MKKLLGLLILFVFLLFPSHSFAQTNSYANIVNPIRGADFWDLPNQKPEDAVLGQIEVLKQKNVSATWLIRYDALKNDSLLQAIQSIPTNHEKGLFLEVTPSFTTDAGVNYRKSQYWHFAESVLLTGYEVEERRKLIDTSFEKFKSIYGFYPKSVGAWWIDAGSISYMQEKYDISSVLVCADQYSTDNYQIWGQYWSTPYYPRIGNALYPAHTSDQKIPVVMFQWAARDPVNGYGKGVEESTYAVQANDYIDYHDLDINYFAKLVDIYTTQKHNSFGEIVIGLENTYDWGKYKSEYEKQVQILVDRRTSGQLQINTMSQFASWYKNRFPDISPEHAIVADDPLGSERKVVWFMNPFYRAGWFSNNQGSVFRDVRQYVEGDKEPCLEIACKEVNFATFKTRTLDEVTFQDKYVVSPGRITNFSTKMIGEELQVTYQTDAAKERLIAFLPRDIKLDDRVLSIDGLILLAKEQQLLKDKKITIDDKPIPQFYYSYIHLIGQLLLFVLFLLFAIIIPGLVISSYLRTENFFLQLFLSFTVGLVSFTLFNFVVGISGFYFLNYLYALIALGLFVRLKLYKHLDIKVSITKFGLLLTVLIIFGVFFQTLAVIRSGWVYEFGMGFWGPTGHDHVWHQALNNQIIHGVPPENPIFSGVTLTNYHYFFNILVGVTGVLTNIDLVHLLYRFYPILFSLLLGIGFYLLSQKLFNNRFVSVLTLYFLYFGSSFGWVVDYMRSKTLGGESNFWINQPVSFNLNPPFAISMVLLLSVILIFGYLVKNINTTKILIFVLVAGCLIEFKVYAGLVVITALLMVSLQQFLLFRSLDLFKSFIPTILFSILLFLPQNQQSTGLVVFQPFWFIHAMVDSPDRLGITKLAEARMAYQQRGEILKFVLTEVLAFAIFIAGNLGTRILALLLIPALLLKKVRNNLPLSFVIWMILISFTVPILFIQKGTPWNTIQFSYYGLYLLSLFAAFALWRVYQLLPKVIGVIILTGIFIITPISSYATFEGGFGKIPPARLTFGEMEGLDFLSKQDKGVVLTHPYIKEMRERFDPPFPLFAYETSSYISAFSKKPTFVEDEFQMEIFQIDYKKRLVLAQEFFRGRDAFWSKEFLKSNNIRYIYLPKVYGIALAEEEVGIEKIFENSQVDIFKVE